MHTPRATPNSEPRMPMVNGQRIGISPLAMSTACLFKTPSPEVPILDQTPPGLSYLSGPTLPRHFGISRIANPRHKVPCCWKPRTPKPRFSGFVPPVLPTIDGSHEIGKSLFAISTCMQLLHSPTPICRNAMANEFHLRLEVNSFSRVQVVDSLPLEESFAPKLLPFGLHLGLFHNTCKELSLLSFHQLSTQNHSELNSSIRSHTQHMKEVRNKKQICKGIMPTTHRK
jgi:hypothetical protein